MSKFTLDDLDSTDITTVVNCLNSLTKFSYENPAQIVQPILSIVLISFGELLETLNPFRIKLHIPCQLSLSVSSLVTKKQRIPNWEIPSYCFDPVVLQALHHSIDDNTVVLMILNIIRNYSSESGNETLIASSTLIINHIWSILMTSHYPSLQSGLSTSAAIQISFEILCNIASKIDLSGNMKLRSSVFEDCTAADKKEGIVIQLSSHFSTISPEYVQVTDALVTTLFLNLRTRQHRTVALKSLDLLSRLAAVSDNAFYFQSMPDTYLECIVDYLNVSYSFLDPYTNTRASANATSVPPVVVESFSDVTDNEFRDLSLEVIAQLCANSAKMQSRFSEVKYFFKYLLTIIRNLKSEKTNLRSIDVNLSKAVQLLNQVLGRTTDMSKLYSLQLELCTEFGDDFLSDTVCSNFYLFGQQRTSYQVTEEYVE